jgi:hypothetical protein
MPKPKSKPLASAASVDSAGEDWLSSLRQLAIRMTPEPSPKPHPQVAA